MKQLIFVIIAVLCVNVCYAQNRNTDSLYASSQSKKAVSKNHKKKFPLKVNHELMMAGAVTIGTGLCLLSFSNAAIADKLKDESDPDKIEKLQKNQKMFNYISGGLGVVGCILCLSSIKRDYSGGYAITKKLSLKDKNRGLALVYRF